MSVGNKAEEKRAALDKADTEYCLMMDPENHCPICGSFSPRHIQEDDDGPCREVLPFSWYSR